MIYNENWSKKGSLQSFQSAESIKGIFVNSGDKVFIEIAEMSRVRKSG